MLTIGDLNLSVDNSHPEDFLQCYDLSSLINKPCYQSNTPIYIELILSNRESFFKLSNTFETGVSDHHKLVFTVVIYGGFEKLYNDPTIHSNLITSKNTLKFELEKVRSKLYGEFEAVFLKELSKHAPVKTKFLRHNKPFMTNKIVEKK